MIMQQIFPGVSPTLLALLVAALTGGTLLVVVGMGAGNPVYGSWQ